MGLDTSNGSFNFTWSGVDYSVNIKDGTFKATGSGAGATQSVAINLKDATIIGNTVIKEIPGMPGVSMSVSSNGNGTFTFSSPNGLASGTIKYNMSTGEVTGVNTSLTAKAPSWLGGGTAAQFNLSLNPFEIQNPDVPGETTLHMSGTKTLVVFGEKLFDEAPFTVDATGRSVLGIFAPVDGGKLTELYDFFKNHTREKQLQDALDGKTEGINNFMESNESSLSPEDQLFFAALKAADMRGEMDGSGAGIQGPYAEQTGPTTNYIDISTHNSNQATGAENSDPTTSISSNESTLASSSDFTLDSLLGNVNLTTGLGSFANYTVSDGYRPGNQNLFSGSLTDQITLSAPSDSSTVGFGLNIGLTGTQFNSGSNYFFNLLPTDPLVLDLNGDGVKLTNFSDAPVLFDADNDGGSREQTGWVSAEDGIVVHDRNGNGVIDNISETLSEYYNGVAGSNGNAGTKPYLNGFAALKSLDSNGDNLFSALDAAFGQLRVWVDSNHDGKSWVDANNNGVKDAGELSELKTFAELGITQVNLAAQAQSGEVRDGNEVLARGTYVKDGTVLEAVAANFLNNPAGSTITQTASGVTASLDGSTTKSYVSGNVSASLNETLNVASLGVKNITGGAGNDTLTGNAEGNWLAGGLGADVFNAGAGDDVILADAQDLSNPQAINGGDGLDMVQVIGSRGISFNMSQSQVEIVVGNVGDDVIIGGGSTSVFVRAGGGDDLIIGSTANDALSGEDGNDYIDGGAGNDVLRGHRGRDQISGADGDDVIDGGLDDDRISGGAGDDVLKGGGGDDVITGGAGIDVAQYSGSYADYRVTKLNDTTWRVIDTRTGRDGSDTIKDVEKLSFSDVSQVNLTEANALPVKDILTKDGVGTTLSRTGSYYISKSQLLGNDRNWQGSTLSISSVLEAKGGTATLITNTADAHFGDILFTPDASYKGVMSFKYQVKDANNVITNVVNPATGASEQMKGTVYLQTPDLPSDPLLLEQWYLSDANVLPVWNDYTGKGVRIGQFEPGGPYSAGPEVFDYQHSDLQSNVDKAWLNDTATPVPQTFSNHATMVAGVMVAARNGEGAVGVAYDAKLSGHYIQGEGLEVDALGQEITNALAKFKNYDIVNNSWGATDDFDINVLPAGALETGIKDAVTNGRKGLGTAIVMAAGNDRESGANTNTNALTANRAVITVGAINAPGDLGSLQMGQKPFSNPGASILVSAAGSNVDSTSRELINDNGSVFGSDTSASQGTSFAAPLVSGVIALMLEANPSLGYRDIQTILAMTAVKFDDPNGTDWTFNAAKNWNGGGMHASHDYGFGKVDARAAVRLAETWYDSSTEGNVDVKSVSSGTLNATISDAGATYTSTLTAAAGVEVESAQVTVEIDHQRWGDLIIKLVSPSGTESILLNRTGKAPGSGAGDVGATESGLMNFSFNTTHVRGEQSGGAWKLLVIDAATGSVGTVKNWKLDLYGSSVSNGEDTYVYTNEFGTFTGTQRSTLTDTNGGKDILNASAVSSGSILNLTNGSVSTIAGKNVTVNGDIEYAYGGDGNDSITGNALSNVLQGGRGDDTISGGAGGDLLIGGQGANRLTGGADQDIFAVRRYAGAVDTITDFDAASGIEKIAIIGFASIDDYTKLTVAQEGSDSRITLLDGQSILVKSVLPSQLSEQNFSFFSDYDIFTQYLKYVSNSPVGVGTFNSGDNTVVLTSTTGSLQSYGLGGNDQMASRSQNDLLDGGNGNDTIWGDYIDVAGGYPTIVGGADWIEGGAGLDVIRGGGGDDSIFGGSGNDQLYGEEGNDLLVGGTGQDYVNGAAGNDTLILDGDIGSVSTGAFDYFGTRAGGAGADTFKVSATGGGTSGLTLSGGLLNMSNMIGDFNVAEAGEVIDLTAFAWIRGFSDLSISSIFLGSVSIARITATNGAESVNLALNNVTVSSLNASHFKFAPNPGFVGGGSGADSLVGDAGANTIDGLAGADTMVGRTGDDTYLVDNAGDVIDELPGGGFDTAVSSVSYTLSSNVEGLTLTGGSNLNATGNAERNRLRGNAGNNRLDGGAEADDLAGGAGDDTYVVDDQLDTVLEAVNQGTDTVESSVSWGLGANIENVTLTGTAAINATGNELGNRLVGNSSDNVLDGSEGADTMEGGLGNDTYYIDNVGDVITENANEGSDSVYVSFTYSLADKPNIENVTLYGSAAASLTGNAQSNILIGNAVSNTLAGAGGDDILDGGAGVDTMTGGTGNDTYYLDDAADLINENDGEGTDTVIVKGVSSYTLRPFVENGSRITGGTLIGNELNNSLNGSNGADTLRGENGADTLSGGAGNDVLIGGTGNDRYVFSRGMGSDLITEAAGTSAGVDAIEFADGIVPADLIGVRDGTSITISLASGEQIKFDWTSGAGNAIEQFIFNGGSTVWGVAEINQLVNKAPTGSVSISGTVSQGQTLTASNTLADGDGLGAITYQWLRDGVATGGTGATYALTQADVGKKISVKAVYTDTFGTTESVTSAQTANVANVNDAPTITSAATATVAENATAVMTVVGADVDAGSTLTYAIAGGADAAKFTINSSTGALAFAAAPNFEAPTDNGANNVYDVTVQVSDGSLTATKAVAVTVTNVNEAPTITSAATASVAENSASVLTVTSSDQDAGATKAYSIVGGADAAKFTINSSTGALAFVAAQNFEAPTDVGANNVYDVTVQVSDGSLTATKAVAVTVTNVNEAPTITSAATASVAENSTVVLTVTSSDPDAGATKTYSIAGGADAAKFTINSSTGALAFAAAPNFEAPTDNGANNVYDVTVQVSDGSLTATQAIAVTVTNANEAPTITSAATASVTENTTAVLAVTSSDQDAGATKTYSIVGGADAAKFTINSSTGALAFVAAQNFEAPTDVGANNVYDVTVQVSDGSLTATQAVAVTVTNANEAPTITSAATASVAENSTAVLTVTSTDPDAGASKTYSIVGGADAAKFMINSSTGALAFAAAPNFEAPTDVGANNVYDVTVQVSDGSLTATQAIAVTVTNANEAPTITSAATASVTENTTAVLTVTSSDPDAGASKTYSIVGGADAAKFTINSSTGALAFAAAPNYEAPTDSGANNVYDVTVQVSDGSLTATQAVAVTVTNANEAPTITSAATASVTENTTAVLTVTSSDPDAGATKTYSIAGGADAAKFTINSSTGALAFAAAPNFEAPTDVGANNVYDVTVQVSDGSLTATKAVAVTVTNVNEAPTITSAATASVAENSTAVLTVTSSDQDAGATKAYSIVGGADAAKFTINSSTGALAFAAAPNFEAPTDVGANNVYDVTVQVSDGSLTATQAVAVTVTNANEAPTITSAATASVTENTTAVLTVTSSDPDAGATKTYSIAGGADAAKFTINSSTGALAFAAAPNFEAPTDVGANNVYDVTVQVSDGSLTATKAIAVTVTNANDAPTGGVTVAGSAVQGETLVASNTLADADGLGSITYQWIRDSAVVATGASYVLGQADVGKQLSVKAIYTDGLGNAEAVSSTQTEAIASGNLYLLGTEGHDSLVGGNGNDTLDGDIGIDTLVGGSGDDLYYVDETFDENGVSLGLDVVVEGVNGGVDTIELLGGQYVMPDNVEHLIMGAKGDSAAGNALDNSITGSSLGNYLIGLDGNDTLLGLGGNDSLQGDAGDDSLNGGTGNDTLDGGIGIDVLVGGTGDDIYYVDETLDADGFSTLGIDSVVENVDGGTDTVYATVLEYVLTDNVENLVMDGKVGTGNALNNHITGSVDANTISGLDGDDTILGLGGGDSISGGAGNDSIDGGDGGDTLVGNEGDDILFGGSGLDRLSGGAGADTLFGGEGDNILSGGLNSDTLASGTGNDTFSWGRDQGADILDDTGGTDLLNVLAGVTADQVWLRQVSGTNNLEISVIGTSDTFTVNNWYLSAANQVESIKLSDGKALNVTGVQNLVNAMASFSPPAAGQTTLPADYQTSLNTAIAANWA